MLPNTGIEATTHNLIKAKMTEGVFTNSALLKRVREKQEIEDGGKKIIASLMVVDDTGTTGKFYSSRDELSLDEYDGISASEHNWKFIEESIVIYKTDIALNGGRLGVLKWAAKKVQLGERAMRQRLTKGILSDGTNTTGALSDKQFIGLQAIIAASGTYGQIAPADLATWVSFVDDNSGVNRAITKAIADGAYDEANEGEDGPTLGIFDKNVFTQFKGLLTAQQRTTRDSSMDGFGHKGTALVYNGIDHIVENQMPANTIFYIDEERAKLHVQKDNNMRVQLISDLETKDAQLHRIFLYAEYVSDERKFHSRINDITV